MADSERDPDGTATTMAPVLVEFASGLAHELSNALNGVGMYGDMARLLLERGEIEKARTMLDGLQAEFQRNIALMNALRRFASVPNQLRPSTQAADTLLADGRDSACLLLDLDPARIELRCPADCPIQADREALVYVLVQLIRNAVEANARRITVSASNGGEGIRILVEDDGDGIDAELRPRLFAMFASSRRQHGHLGLGLWLVDHICRAQHASVRAFDPDAGGAGFALEFPA